MIQYLRMLYLDIKFDISKIKHAYLVISNMPFKKKMSLFQRLLIINTIVRSNTRYVHRVVTPSAPPT